MQRMFPHALFACIAEDRAPQPQELECVTEQMLREAFGGVAGYGRSHAVALAHAALAGVETGITAETALAA